MNDDRHASAADARAAVEAQKDEREAALEAAFRDRYGEQPPGRSIIVADAVATGIFAVLAALAAVSPSTFVGVYFVVSLLWFLAGSVLFFVALAGAAQRSRTDAIGIGGLFFLVGSAPRAVRLQLRWLLAVQVIVAVAAASVRPFTPLAFGTLAPMLGLGFCGLWASKFGVFGPRDSATR